MAISHTEEYPIYDLDLDASSPDSLASLESEMREVLHEYGECVQTPEELEGLQSLRAGMVTKTARTPNGIETHYMDRVTGNRLDDELAQKFDTLTSAETYVLPLDEWTASHVITTTNFMEGELPENEVEARIIEAAREEVRELAPHVSSKEEALEAVIEEHKRKLELSDYAADSEQYAAEQAEEAKQPQAEEIPVITTLPAKAEAKTAPVRRHYQPPQKGSRAQRRAKAVRGRAQSADSAAIPAPEKDVYAAPVPEMVIPQPDTESKPEGLQPNRYGAVGRAAIKAQEWIQNNTWNTISILQEKSKGHGHLALGALAVGVMISRVSQFDIFHGAEHALPEAGGGMPPHSVGEAAIPEAGGSVNADTISPHEQGVQPGGVTVTIEKGENVYSDIARSQGYDPHHLTSQQAAEVGKLSDYAFAHDKDLIGVKATAVQPGTEVNISAEEVDKIRTETGVTAPVPTPTPEVVPAPQPASEHSVEVLPKYNAETGEGTFIQAAHNHLDKMGIHLTQPQFNRILPQLLEYDRSVHLSLGQPVYQPEAMPIGYWAMFQDDLIRHVVEELEKTKIDSN